VQPGDVVPAGKLLLVLDDTQARARVATAESGVKAAQAALEAATHNGTQQERRQRRPILPARLERDQARHDLDALIKLNSTGAASPAKWPRPSSGWTAAEASLHASQQSAQSRYSPAEVARAQAALSDAEANLAAARSKVVAQTSIHAPHRGNRLQPRCRAHGFCRRGQAAAADGRPAPRARDRYFDEPDWPAGRRPEIVIKWDAKPGRGVAWAHRAHALHRDQPTARATWARCWCRSTMRTASCCPTPT
jgi:HlyD family secretion protein